MIYFLFGLLLGCLIGFLKGWVFAHETVAKECERLGRFFVNKKVFECTLIREIQDEKAVAVPENDKAQNA